MERIKYLSNVHLWMVFCIAIIMTGCRDYKMLDVIDEPHSCPVKIHFDWSNVDSIPTQMRIGLYPLYDNGSTGSYTWLDVGNRDTIVYAPEGSWRMTAWNRDVTHIVYEDFGRCDMLSVTSTDPFTNFNSRYLKHILDSIFPGEIIKDYPDYMVHDNSEMITITPGYDEQTINVCPDSMVTTINITARGIKGLDLTKMTKGALSNVAGKRYIAHKNKTADKVTVLFSADTHPDKEMVTATFWVFGIEPENIKDLRHHVALFFWASQGQAFVDLDVTSDVHSAMEEGKDINIDIMMDIDLRDLFTVGGFDIEIEDWPNLDIPVGL